MTEAEWLDCEDPTPMLEFLRGQSSGRKLRLYTCAWCRYYCPELLDTPNWMGGDSEEANESDLQCFRGLQVAERFADGRATDAELSVACSTLVRWAAVWGNLDLLLYYHSAIVAAATASSENQSALLPPHAPYALDAGGVARQVRDKAKQAKFLRDLFGNPFCRVPIDPDWLRWTNGAIPKLAQTIYDDRAFNQMPALADALVQAGCTNEDILAHCRSGGEHVRGCWVVDLMLGKE